MKFSQDVPPKVFIPVTITLETQGEVDLFTSYLGATGSEICTCFNVSRDEMNSLYYKLNKEASSARRTFIPIKLGKE